MCLSILFFCGKKVLKDGQGLVYPITLWGRWGTRDDFTTISFHLVLSSAARVELA